MKIRETFPIIIACFKMKFSLLFLPLLSGLTLASPLSSRNSDKAPSATTNSTTYVGLQANGSDIWRGIGYAKPPVGKLRLMPPQKLTPASGTIQAQTIPHSCYSSGYKVTGNSLNAEQNATYNELYAEYKKAPAVVASAAHVSQATPSEDCLYLDIHRPAGTKSTSKLPVIVWFYGGAFAFGDLSRYDPASLLNRSVALDEPIIYVAVNYRLNAYGFLTGDEVQKNSKSNIGLRDQRMALQWVHDNIDAFGGCKKKVTIWGESAGAISVAMQLVHQGSKSSNGLYRGAIMQSGSPYHVRKAEGRNEAFNIMANYTGCSNSSNPFTCLQDLPVAQFQAAMSQVPNPNSETGAALLFGPAVDGDFLPDYPDRLVKAGRFNRDVNIYTGDLVDEGEVLTLGATVNITSEADFEYFTRDILLPGLSKKDYETLAQQYPADAKYGSPYGTGEANNFSGFNKRVGSLFGDFTFQQPRRLFCEMASDLGSHVYSYIYSTYRSTPLVGSYHGSDQISGFGWLPGPITDEFQARIVGFVNHGKPDSKGYSTFPAYSSKTKKVLNFGVNSSSLDTDTYRGEPMNKLKEILFRLDD